MICLLFALCYYEKAKAPEVPLDTKNPVEAKLGFITPELKAICAAESTGDWTETPKHWNKDGTVLTGIINNNDIGQCQINKIIWGEKSKELGYDIYSFNGNIQMANWIYEKYGNKPWFWSKKLWDK